MIFSFIRRPLARRIVRLLIALFVLSAAPGCTKFDLLNATVPSQGAKRSSDIHYGPERRQTLDMYRPKTAEPGHGVVIFLYGGEWKQGRKNDYKFVGEALASRGFVAVVPDYRLYPEVTFPTFVQDAALAVRWTHDHAAEFGADPKHIFLMGHSAGAHIAMLLTLDGRYLQSAGLDAKTIRGTASLAGVFDFIPWDEDRATFNMKPGDKLPSMDIEPLHFATNASTPLLLIHCANDKVVDPQNLDWLSKAVRESGGDVQTIVYPRGGHATPVLSLAWSFRWLAPTLNDVTAFFRELESRR